MASCKLVLAFDVHIGHNYGQDTNETGVFYHLSTDQVRFYPIASQPSLQHASGGQYETRADEPIQQPPSGYIWHVKNVRLAKHVSPPWVRGVRQPPHVIFAVLRRKVRQAHKAETM